jgi:predicted nucleic acid-binding protein
MPTYLLDTSVYSQPLRKRPLAGVKLRWETLGDDELCISVVCLAELLTGLRRKNSETLWRAYETILKDRLPVLDVTPEVADSYARLAARALDAGHPRPAFDLLIAATARANGLTVATCNHKHFVGLEGVAVEDWTRSEIG